MKLIIAEKPSVANAIAPVVGATSRRKGYTEGNGYIVSWCYGHLVGLSMPDNYCEEWAATPWTFEQLPMIPERWKFRITDSSKEQFMVLKQLMADSRVDSIICATDADREGECIFRYVYNLCGCKKPVMRLWVSSLEAAAIRTGLSQMQSSSKYNSLFNAGFSRAKADWLVGMNFSRLFSVRYDTRLNTGRVQTPTLAMIVKRDADVKNFVKQKYFTVELNCGQFIAVSDRIDDESTAAQLTAACNGSTAELTEVKKENKKESPPKLYDLTTLQRDANKMFGYTAQQTLDAMQGLYEAKLATYPRTDSQYLSDDMEASTTAVIQAILNASTFRAIVPDTAYTPDVKRCINNAKVTGHHAIIPTMSGAKADLNALPEEQRNILLLIAFRLMCATAMPHRYTYMSVTVSCNGKLFYATGKEVVEAGWKAIEQKAKAVLKKKSEDDEPEEQEQTLPELQQGMKFTNVTAEKAEHWTSPPRSYTEDTLLSAMEHAGQDNYDDETEKKGLGTPATRAGIIEALEKHGYIQRKGKKISATEKGVTLIGVVPEEVKSPKLTADWEMKLQQIERGTYNPAAFMQEITDYVRSTCSKYSSEDSGVTFAKPVQFTGKCPKCGSEVKKGKFGFYCTAKCGMFLSKVFGKELTETQLTSLLSGKSISFTRNGTKTIVLPEVVENTYSGKTNWQWKTKKG